MMDGSMGGMMAWMMGFGLLGWVLVVALLVAILVVAIRLLGRARDSHERLPPPSSGTGKP